MNPQSAPGLAAAAAIMLTVALSAAPAARAEEGELSINEGVLDRIILKTLTPPKDAGVIVRLFPTDRADLGTAEEGDNQKRVDAAVMMKNEGPRVLAEQLTTVLSLGGTFRYARQSEETPIPEDSIVIEGRFTKIDPGSRAKRFALFGAGKSRSGIAVEGVVKSASGEVMAEFSHERNSGIGVGGGDYVKFLMDDTRDVATDIAKFLKRWATGGDLHSDD